MYNSVALRTFTTGVPTSTAAEFQNCTDWTLLIVQRNLASQGKWMLPNDFIKRYFFFNQNNFWSIGTGNHRDFPVEIPLTTHVPTACSIQSVSGVTPPYLPGNRHLGHKPAPGGQPRAPCPHTELDLKKQPALIGGGQLSHLPPHPSEGHGGMAWHPLAWSSEKPDILIRAVGKVKNWVSLLYVTWRFS